MEIEKIMFGSAVTSDEKIDEVQRIRDHLRRNPVDESILTCLIAIHSLLPKHRK